MRRIASPSVKSCNPAILAGGHDPASSPPAGARPSGPNWKPSKSACCHPRFRSRWSHLLSTWFSQPVHTKAAMSSYRPHPHRLALSRCPTPILRKDSALVSTAGKNQRLESYRGSRILRKQDRESFVRKVMIVGQYFGRAKRLHCEDGRAEIGRASCREREE